MFMFKNVLALSFNSYFLSFLLYLTFAMTSGLNASAEAEGVLRDRELIATLEGCEAEDLRAFLSRSLTTEQQNQEIITASITPGAQLLAPLLFQPEFLIECGNGFCDVRYRLGVSQGNKRLQLSNEAPSPNLTISLGPNPMGRLRYLNKEDARSVFHLRGFDQSVIVFFDNSSMINYRIRLELICQGPEQCGLVEDVVLYLPYDDDLKCGSMSEEARRDLF